jgi:hypothetical protein
MDPARTLIFLEGLMAAALVVVTVTECGTEPGRSPELHDKGFFTTAGGLTFSLTSILAAIDSDVLR